MSFHAILAVMGQATIVMATVSDCRNSCHVCPALLASSFPCAHYDLKFLAIGRMFTRPFTWPVYQTLLGLYTRPVYQACLLCLYTRPVCLLGLFTRPVYQACLLGQYTRPVYQACFLGLFTRPEYQNCFLCLFTRPVYQASTIGLFSRPSYQA